MPPARKVTFEVVNETEYMGMFIPYPMRIQMSTSNETFYQVAETLLHEMVHLYLFYNNHTDYNQHEQKFNEIADKVCESLMLSREHFG